MAVFFHVTIYAASSAFHMATALYVSALLLDIMSVLKRCDTITNHKDLQPFVRDANIKQTLNEAVALHVNVLE